MYVAVHHNITNPDRFWEVLESASAGSGNNGRPRRILRNPTGDKAVVLWEAESLDAARDHVESLLGEHSENEYEPVKSLRSWRMK